MCLKILEEISAESRKEQRSEIFEEVYNGVMRDAGYHQAVRELQMLDEEEHEFECPLQGCKDRFCKEDGQQHHVQMHPSKGHSQYHNAHTITGADLKKPTLITPSRKETPYEEAK
jgi:hypothetical protein